MPITIKVKLFAILRINRFAEREITMPEGSRIADVIRQLEIAPEDVAFFLCNGKREESEKILTDGDTLSLFPLIGGG